MLAGRWLTSLLLLFLAVGCGSGDPSGNPPSGNPPSTISVTGKVTDNFSKKGLAYATVVIGSQHTTTDATGAFSVAGVTAPYDATVIEFGGITAYVFKGLTRADPTLPSRFIFDPVFPPSTGAVTGSVSGGDALPAPLDITAVAWGSPETSNSSQISTNPWSLGLWWVEPSVTTGNLHALQWTPTYGIPTSYKGYGAATGVTVTKGGSATPVAIAMTAPGASTISGTVTLPADMTLLLKALSIDFADGARFRVAQDNTAAFTYPVPTGIGSTASVSAIAFTASLVQSITEVKGIDAGSTGITMNVLAPAMQSTPADKATGVSTRTDFTWSTLAGALHVVKIESPASRYILYLLTTGSTARIPDLSAFGFVLPASAEFDWDITALAPWESVDAVASGDRVGLDLMPNRGNVSTRTHSAPWTFTSQ